MSGKDSTNLPTILTLTLMLLVSLLIVGCSSTSGTQKVKSNQSGCSGILPTSAIRSKDVNIGVASLAVQQISVSNLEASYADTIHKLLSDTTTRRWVRTELECQNAKLFKTPEGKRWYLAMVTIAEHGDSQDLVEFFDKYPSPNELGNVKSDTEDKNDILQSNGDTLYIDTIEGDYELSLDVKTVIIETITPRGDLYVPGETKVTVKDCNGDVHSSDKADIRLKNIGVRCDTYELDG